MQQGTATLNGLVDRVVDMMRLQVFAKTTVVGGLDAVSARSVVIQFLLALFCSLEHPDVRSACLPLVSVGVWSHVSEPLVEHEMARTPALRKLWRHAERRMKEGRYAGTEEARRNKRNGDFVPELVADLISQLLMVDHLSDALLAYIAKMLEFLILVESQLATRRFVNLVLADFQLAELCQRVLPPDGSIGPWQQRAKKLVAMLRGCVDFQVDDVSGLPLSDAQARDRGYKRLAGLQKHAFAMFPEALDNLAVASIAALGDPEVLKQHLCGLDRQSLAELAKAVGLRTRLPGAEDSGWTLPESALGKEILEEGGWYTHGFVLELFAERYRHRGTVGDAARSLSAFITEQQLFDRAVIEADELRRQPLAASGPQGPCIGYPTLALPRLGLQYLTLHDYLARNFRLLQAETAFEIREDAMDAVRRLQPQDDNGMTRFDGWARMALPLREPPVVVGVRPPRLGEQAPAAVRTEIMLDLTGYVESVRREWDEDVRPRDSLVLLAVHPGKGSGDLGIVAARGCEVDCRLDAAGRPIDELSTSGGAVRRFRVLMDPRQHYADSQQGDDDPYAMFNVVLRRRPQDTGGRALMEALRDMMAAPPTLPDWLAAVFLGYGDPASATALHQKNGLDAPVSVYMGDTFVSEAHLRQCFAGQYAGIEFTQGCFAKPCIVELPVEGSGGVLRVSSQPTDNRGPIDLRRPRENQVEFTPAQAMAIQSAAMPGLTLVVGPPGTGKTDVAAQAIANLYHAHPRQTTLLITHSNQALNQLFEKIIALDIEPRHLLRLGHGEENLDVEERYSKAGRVESFLARRDLLLADVQVLAESLNVAGDFGYTCDSARLFFIAHVRTRWTAYRRKHLDSGGTCQDIIAAFPFTAFFERKLGRPLFDKEPEMQQLVHEVEGCFLFIESLFDELAALQPFELLRSSNDRSNYLLTSQARIVAMTCAHAAMKRSDLLQLGFRYDSVVMEEAAQILDVETFIPLVLQNPRSEDKGGRRLKRLVMIGDHNQLPPVVKNSGLQAYANLDQSLFTRLVRLGVPYVELNKQARARTEIASLYRFRYRDLGDLPVVSQGAFMASNPGFLHTYQFINVGDFRNTGETQPSRYFYQNLGEAEYLVAVYQYMRLLGYAAEKITILTTYNGQRTLISEVLEKRCGWHSYFGRPRAISTVDRYQGQQNDFVLLSLVRSSAVGHLRDIRRVTVALSRARLGLYVFGRRSVFEQCWELREVMRKLLKNGDKLMVCPGEKRAGSEISDVKEERVSRSIGDVEEMGAMVYGMIEQMVQASEEEEEEEEEAPGDDEDGTSDDGTG
ncbi:hypothetical protein IWW45_008200, partial [Coemansia sp. RSA 485]